MREQSTIGKASWDDKKPNGGKEGWEVKIDYKYIKLRPKIFWNEKEDGLT